MNYHAISIVKSALHDFPASISKVKKSGRGSGQKKIIPWQFRLTGSVLNFVSLFNNKWAARQLGRLWFTVFKNKPKPWVKKFWMQADRRFEVNLKDQEIAVYCWGKGPLIVLMHGWSGSGTQFRYFIPALVKAGYRVAVFDAPGHGSNPGKYSDVLKFSDCLVAIQQQIAPVNTVIAHSLGAMATTLATHRGLMPARLVLIAPHLDIYEMFNAYADMLNLRKKLKQSFQNYLKYKIDQLTCIENSWDLFTTKFLLQDREQSGLLVFDHDDEEVPQQHFKEIEYHWVNADMITTQGLGHTRLLRDTDVIEKVVNYLNK